MEEPIKDETPLDLSSVLQSLPNIRIEAGGQFIVNLNTSSGGEIKSTMIGNSEIDKSTSQSKNIDRGLMSKVLTYIAFPAIIFLFKSYCYDDYYGRYSFLKNFLEAEKHFFEFEKKLDFELDNGTLYVACRNHVNRLKTISNIISRNDELLKYIKTSNELDGVQILNSNIKYVYNNLEENLERLDLMNQEGVNAFRQVVRDQNENLSSLFNGTRLMLVLENQKCIDQSPLPFYLCIKLKDIEEKKFPFLF